MSNNIENITSYQSGESLITGDFLISTESPIKCNVSVKEEKRKYELIEEKIIYGCMDPKATNFDPKANIDDGSCEYFDCFIVGMQISVKFSNTLGPCPQRHRCNAAIFYLLVNNINIGLIDLNNQSDGGDRSTTLLITSDVYPRLNLSNSSESMTLQLICAIPPNVRTQYWGFGECHNNVPWVYIEDGIGRLVYNACPATNTFEVPLLCSQNVYGCMDPNALNYNPNAYINDGSCVYPI